MANPFCWCGYRIRSRYPYQRHRHVLWVVPARLINHDGIYRIYLGGGGVYTEFRNRVLRNRRSALIVSLDS